jgi:hypothetical protein
MVVLGALLGATLLLDRAARTGVGEAPDGTAPRATAAPSQSTPSGDHPNQPSAAEPTRQREGARLLNEPGTFRITGDRATFICSDGKRQFIGLENLGLERVVRTIVDDSDQVQWLVSGVLTEYQGTNYLLITRAVLTTRGTTRTLSPPADAAAPAPGP